MKPNQEKYNFIWTLILGLWAIGIQAQTTNTGTVYVSPDTEFSTVEDFDNTSTGEFYNDGEAFLYADFNNDGKVDFYQQTGTTLFIGAEPQLISGNEESFFYNLYFDNQSVSMPFQLSGRISTSGTVDFRNGIVDIDNYGGRFTFIDNAESINVTDFSHVDGPVEKYGHTDFRYPIGDSGYYRFAGIASLQTPTALFEAKYFLENSADLYPHHLKPDVVEFIDDQEYWTIKPIATDNESVMLTLSWRSETTPAPIIDGPQEGNIHIVRWDVEQNMWIDEGGVVNVNNQTVTTAVEKYGVFTLARVKGEDVLPCQLVVYNAVTPNGDGINDFFRIDQSNNTCAQNLHVQVFNRWGVKVFETHNYGEDGDLFTGYSNGRMTIQDETQLPTGTYFYILDYDYDTSSGTKNYKKAGYLYLNGN